MMAISNMRLKSGWGTKMSRPSEITRDRILKTAVRLFAERGYEATSIRTLAAKAYGNQAAINYHFKTKGRAVP